MTITHIAMPALQPFRAVTFSLVGRSQEHVSPFSGAAQVAQLSGAYWRARYELAPLTAAQAPAWKAFLAQLRGRANAFYGYDPDFQGYGGLAAITSDPAAWRADATSPKADATTTTADEWVGDVSSPGAPYVRVGAQTGSTLKTAGWLPGLVLAAGEYVSFDVIDSNGNTLRSLHMLTAAETVTDGGNANLEIVPPIRITPASGALLYVSNPACSMRLVADDAGRWSTDVARHTRIAFDAVQVLTGEA